MNPLDESSNELNLLMLEDNAIDAELLSTTLAKASLNFNFMRVETEVAFRSTLEAQSVDIILADYSLPTFDGISAIQIATSVCPDVPCILVSGVLGEERAIDALKSGATDYVLKQRLERLIPAVERALNERQEKLARQKAERERAESERRFQALMETIADPLAVMISKREQGIVQDFIVIHLNDSACDYLSIPLVEARDRSICTVVPAFREARAEDSSLRFLDQLIGVVETGIVFSAEIILEGHDYADQRVAIEVKAARLNDGIVLTWRDVTERYQVAEQRRRLLAETVDALNRAEQANRFKDDFLATVAHELRSPLSTIKGWAKIMERQPESVELVAKSLKIIDRNTVLLENLIVDLLDISRVVEGRLSFSPERLSFERLQKMIANTVDDMSPLASQKNICIRFHTDLADAQKRYLSVSKSAAGEEETLDNDPSNRLASDEGSGLLPRCIMGDWVRLQQVVRNLLSNAIAFTPENGQIEVTLHYEEETISLVVEDTGRGLKAEDLPSLFEPFWQSTTTSTESQQRSSGGLGLGLSISHYIVELHHGSIQAASEGVDKGSTFTVTLPTLSGELAPVLPIEREKEDREKDRENRIRSKDSADFDATTSDLPGLSSDGEIDVCLLQGIKVLVVEDYLDALEMYKMMLETYGAKVEGAVSIEAAVVAFKSAIPDVLISDIALPNSDGYALLRRIRSLETSEGGSVPAIALTAFSESQYRTQALLAGFQVHIAKPIGLYELIEAVARLTHRYPN